MAFNVLIVDDSSSMRAVIKKIIRLSGFNVSEYWEAADGAEALEMMNRHWVDLVLSDINMPKMNGIEMIAAMKKNDLIASVPVVMVSTERNEEKVAKCLELGASGYIKKPFRPEQLRDKMITIFGEPEIDERENEGIFKGCDF
jgi:two-component system chemotaxis response regulator CheY